MSKHLYHNIKNISRRIVCALFLMLCIINAVAQDKKSEGSEQLGRALDYFSNGKYREAMLIFEQLNSQYKLNPRFKAYLGVCHYYEWEYVEACKYLDEVIPEMNVYAPHEQNVYYHTAAESHFNLQEYDKAIPLYEMQLNVCFNNEKADAFYRIGFCYMFKEDWHNAYDAFSSSLAYYERFRNAPEMAPRISQIKKMVKSIGKKIKR